MCSSLFHFPLFQPGDIFLEYLGLLPDTVPGEQRVCSRERRVVMNELTLVSTKPERFMTRGNRLLSRGLLLCQRIQRLAEQVRNDCALGLVR